MLRGDVRVAQRLGERVGVLQSGVELARDRRSRATLLNRQSINLALGLRPNLRNVEPGLLQHGDDDAFVLFEEREKQVRVIDDGVAALGRECDRTLHGFPGLHRQSLWSNHGSFLLFRSGLEESGRTPSAGAPSLQPVGAEANHSSGRGFSPVALRALRGGNTHAPYRPPM